MRDNFFFFSTVLFSLLVLLGFSIIALHTSPTLYQNFLRLCGVQASTCQRIIETINPITIISASVLLWVAAIFIWQIVRTEIFLHSKRSRTYPLPNVLRVLSLRRSLQGRIVVVPGSSLFCAGIFKRRIYVGRDLLRELSQKELEAALVHESYHLRSHDPLKILLVTTFSRALFFLPAVRELSSAYLKEKEISADRLAESVVGRRYLSRALYKAFRRGADHASGLPSFAAELAGVRTASSFSSWGWGLTILFLGLGWIIVKSSLVPGGTCA